MPVRAMDTGVLNTTAYLSGAGGRPVTNLASNPILWRRKMSDGNEGEKSELTSEERIFLLEDALMQAQWTVHFLHNCLVNPANGKMNGGYEYAYPDQTLQRLADWAKLVPPPPLCHHSRTEPGCEACERGNEHRRRLWEIRKKLSEPSGEQGV